MPTLTVDLAIRRARIMVGFFLVYLVLLPLILEKFVPVTATTIDQPFFLGICIVSVLEIGVVLAVRNRYPLAREEIALQEGESSRVGKWLRIQIVSYAIAISVALYGVILRVLGASLIKTVPFYAVAIVLLLGWWPRKSGG